MDLILVVGTGKEANSTVEALTSLNQPHEHITDGSQAITYLKDKPVSMVYVANDIEGVSWLNFIQTLRSEPKILFTPIVFIRGEYQSFESADLNKIQKYLFTEIRMNTDEKSVLEGEISKYAVNKDNKQSIHDMLDQAKEALQNGLINKAKEIYEELSKETKEGISIQIGQTQCSRYDVDKYNDELKEILEKDPTNYNLKFQMMRTMISNDNLQDFRTLFNEIVNQLSTDNETFWLKQLGEICLNVRIPIFSEKIATIIEKNAESDNLWEVHIYKARQYLSAGNVDRAELFAQKALKSANKERAEIYNVLGVIEKRKGRIRKALDAFHSAKELTKWDYRISYNIALCLKSLNKYNDAIQCLDEILEKNPSYDKAVQLHQALSRRIA